jgi:hypothetical protein
MTLRRFAPVLALLALPALASQAAADCEPAGPLDEEIPVASVAFVGTVTATRGAVAQFAVSEVWAGEVGPAVEIRGISDNVPGGIGEDDRTWVVGDAYLVVPIVDGPELRDSICTATVEWEPELAELRPATAKILEPEPAAQAGDVPIGPIAVGIVGALVLGASVIAFRRR